MFYLNVLEFRRASICAIITTHSLEKEITKIEIELTEINNTHSFFTH